MATLLSPDPTAQATLRVADAIRDQWTRSAVSLIYPNHRDIAAWNAFRGSSVGLAREFLATSIADELAAFFTPVGREFLLIENLPVDPNLPPIPADGMRPAHKQAVSEAVITGLISPWAEIFSYVNEKSGVPIHEVTPVPGMEALQSNSGRTQFGFHSDNAFLPRRFRQQGILLYGLRNRDVATLVITAEQIADAAPTALLNQLSRPAYRHICPQSFQLGSNERAVSEPRAILDYDDIGHVRVKAASSRIEPLDEAARRALVQFRELLSEIEPVRVVVAPGTALLFKDDRVLHGREAFGGERWLQRAYFRESLDELRSVTRSDSQTISFDARRLVAA